MEGEAALPRPLQAPQTPYAKLETPIKLRTRELHKQDTFNSDEADVEAMAGVTAGAASPVLVPDAGRKTSSTSSTSTTAAPIHPRVSGADAMARDIQAADRSHSDSSGDEREADEDPADGATVHLSSMQQQPEGHPQQEPHGEPHGRGRQRGKDPQQLPSTYLNGQFQLNSYFSVRLLRSAQFVAALDLAALACFYFYRRDKGIEHGGIWVPAPIAMLLSTEHSCRTTVALAALVYHLLPAIIVLGLPASGLRVFEPFRREQRIDRGGRLQKVKRTIFLQVCELVGVFIFLYLAIVTGFFVYFFTSGRLFADCDGNLAVYLFCVGAVLVYVLVFVVVRCFARFREHLKMQLGAFKESDQTGDVKAHVLRSKRRRRRRRQELKRQASANQDGKGKANKNNEPVVLSLSAPPPSLPSRSQLVQEVRKRLFRGAQLGDLKLLKRSLRVARTHLGDNFASELYADPSMVFGVFGFARKNPLHVAAYQGNLAAMDLLIRVGGLHVNAFDKVSRVRLSTGDLFWYFARFIIPKPVVSADEAYASSIFKTTLVTPLHCAVSTGRLEAVRWLIERGADVNLCSKSSYRCEHKLPPLFLADNPEIVRVLLVNGANHLAIPDPGHMNTLTVLQLAYLRGNYAVAQVLEDWGGDVALTPLHAAAARNDVPMIRSYLRRKVNPDCLGELGYIGLNKRTPLHWAAINGAVDAVEILLDAGADPNFSDTRGRTPLHWAARVNRLDVVRTLLSRERNGTSSSVADPNVVDESGMTPILCAACAGGTTREMFAALTSAGGDINFPLATTGDTALHLAVKLEDLQTALSLLSLGGDMMRMNRDGLRAIDCTTSTRLQFALKRAAGHRDVMISYTHSHKEFALKLRKSLEAANITVWLDLMDPSGIGGGSVWREEIARGIANAAVVLCVLTEDYAQSEWCLKELALAKQVGTPILALSTERAPISEELQVYLYTRQLVPFEPAITSIERVAASDSGSNDEEVDSGSKGTVVRYTYDEEAYKNQLTMLLDGLRDEIEKRKVGDMRRNLRRQETAQQQLFGVSSSGKQWMLQHAASGTSHKSRGGSSKRLLMEYSSGQHKFDERALEISSTAVASGYEGGVGDFTTSDSVFDSSRSSFSMIDTALINNTNSNMKELEAAPVPIGNSRGPRRRVGGSSRSIRSVGSNNGYASTRGGGRRLNFDLGGGLSGGMSRVSSASSISSMNDEGYGVSDSIVMDTGGYYFHKPNLAEFREQVRSNGRRRTAGSGGAAENPYVTESIVDTYQELATATAGGEQFVFICHGDYHYRFVKKLCVELCREGGLRCFVDRKHLLARQETGDTDVSTNFTASGSHTLADTTISSSGATTDSRQHHLHGEEDLSRRIHEAKEAILKCSAFVLLVSEKTLASELVRDQLAFAEDKGKKILPVVVDRLEFSLDMKYSLARSEFFHFFSKGDMMGFDRSLARLLDAVREEVYGIRVDSRQRQQNRVPLTSLATSAVDEDEHYYYNEDDDNDTSQYSAQSFRSFVGGDFSSTAGVRPTTPRSGLRGGFSDLRESFVMEGADDGEVDQALLSQHYRAASNVSMASMRRRRGMSSPTFHGAAGFSVASSRGEASGFGLPPTRLSQSFVDASSTRAAALRPTGSSRGMASDMSLSQSIIGNFSSIVGRISDDDLDDDELDDALSFTGIQDDDDLDDLEDGYDDDDDDHPATHYSSGSSRGGGVYYSGGSDDDYAMSSTRTWTQRSPVLAAAARHQHLIGIINEDGDFEAAERQTEARRRMRSGGRDRRAQRSGSISILEEPTGVEAATANAVDAMLAAPARD